MSQARASLESLPARNGSDRKNFKSIAIEDLLLFRTKLRERGLGYSSASGRKDTKKSADATYLVAQKIFTR